MFQIKTTITTGALQQCPVDFLPNIHRLLCIFGTIPVTTAQVERTFSMMKYLKNDLRNRMLEDRLNGLAMLLVHHDLTNSDDKITTLINSVVNTFIAGGKRKALWLTTSAANNTS